MSAFLLIQEGQVRSYLEEFIFGFLQIQAAAEAPYIFHRLFCTCRIASQRNGSWVFEEELKSLISLSPLPPSLPLAMLQT